MKTSPESSLSNQRRAMTLLAGAVAFLLFGFASSSCTCRQPVDASALHSPGVIVKHDLPYDYLSAKYRQLFRSDPHLFHRHYEQGYHRSPASK